MECKSIKDFSPISARMLRASISDSCNQIQLTSTESFYLHKCFTLDEKLSSCYGDNMGNGIRRIIALVCE